MADYTTKDKMVETVTTKLGRLGEYILEMEMDTLRLGIELRNEGNAEKFPGYKTLRNFNDTIRNCREVRTKEDADRLADVLETIGYQVFMDVQRYMDNPFRSEGHIQDELTYALGECDDLGYDIRKSLDILDDIYKDLPDKPKKAFESPMAEVTVIASIFMSGLLLFTLKAGAIISTTGHVAAPVAALSGVNFDLVYVLSTATKISIYILGKIMKKW